jgi:hypothetical protein
MIYIPIKPYILMIPQLFFTLLAGTPLDSMEVLGNNSTGLRKK